MENGQRKWLLRPLTAGSTLEHHEAHAEDGRISSMLLMCLVISCGVVLHVSYFIPLPAREAVFQHDLRAVLVVYKTVCVSLSLFIMLWYFLRADAWAKSGVVVWNCEGNAGGESADSRNPSSHHHGNAYLNIGGVFLFGSGKFVLTLFYTIDTIECLNLETAPRAKDDQVVEYLSVVYLIMTLLFTAVQMGFLKKFQSAVFRSSCWFQYSLTVVFFVNILQWLLDFIEDLFHAMSEPASFPTIGPSISINGSSTHDLACLLGESEFDKFIHKVEPYMAPFKLEFSLMSAGMIFNICSSLRDMVVRGGGDEVLGTHRWNWSILLERITTFCRILCCKGSTDSPTGNSERQALNLNDGEEDLNGHQDDAMASDGAPVSSTEDALESHAVVIRPTVDHSVGRPAGSSGVVHSAPRCGAGLVIGIVSVLTLLVLCGLLADNDGTVRNSHIYAYNIFRTVHCFALLVSSWLGFKAIGHHLDTNRSVQPEETLFIVSVTGLFLFRMFHYVAAAGSPNSVEGVYPQGLPRLLCAFATSNIISAFLQTTFLLTAMKYRPNVAESGRMVAEITAFLLVSNLGIWILDSFFQVNPSINTDPLESWFYNDQVWYIASHLTLPLDIFFRFHSFVVACEIYLTFKDHEAIDQGQGNERTV